MRRFGPVLALVLVPTFAMANSGTPLLWSATAYLLFANLWIAAIETKLLAWFAGEPVRYRRLAVANLLSAWVGMAWAVWMVNRPVDPFGPVFAWVVLGWVGAFAITLAVESLVVLPNYAKERSRGWRWSRFVAANGITTLLLLAIFTLLSGWSAPSYLSRDMGAVQIPPGWVYFVRDGQVLRIRSVGGAEERVASMPKGATDVSIETDLKTNRARLVAFSSRWRDEVVEIEPNLGRAEQAAMFFGSPGEEGRISPSMARRFLGEQRDRPSAREQFWAALGLRTVSESGEIHRVVLDTPFLSLRWKVASVGPGPVALAVFGPTVVWVNLNDGKTVRLTRGESASLLLDASAAKPRESHFDHGY